MLRCAWLSVGAVPHLDHVNLREHSDHDALQRLELVVLVWQGGNDALAALGGQVASLQQEPAQPVVLFAKGDPVVREALGGCVEPGDEVRSFADGQRTALIATCRHRLATPEDLGRPHLVLQDGEDFVGAVLEVTGLVACTPDRHQLVWDALGHTRRAAPRRRTTSLAARSTACPSSRRGLRGVPFPRFGATLKPLSPKRGCSRRSRVATCVRRGRSSFATTDDVGRGSRTARSIFLCVRGTRNT